MTVPDQPGYDSLTLLAPAGVPIIKPGDNLPELLLQTMNEQTMSFNDGDILVVAQKIISKAENRYVKLAQVEPSKEALEIAAVCRKDPRLVELVLRESTKVVRVAPDVLIVRHKLGFVHANAGIDHSNIDDGDEQVLLLPENPDKSAETLQKEIHEKTGKKIGVIINDSFGRAWRLGTCGICIGSAGIKTLMDYRGVTDISGKKMEVTEVAWGDEVAAAASLLMGAVDEGRPAVILRGLSIAGNGSSQDLLRPEKMDLFQ